MKEINETIEKELEKMVYDFFADECEVDIDSLTPETNINDDLDGDSLLFVELIELAKKKYSLDIQLQVIGKYMLKHPVETLGRVVEVFKLIYQHENDIVKLGE